MIPRRIPLNLVEITAGEESHGIDTNLQQRFIEQILNRRKNCSLKIVPGTNSWRAFRGRRAECHEHSAENCDTTAEVSIFSLSPGSAQGVQTVEGIVEK